MKTTEVKKIFAADPRIVEIREYRDGWVPNSYRWRAPGECLRYEIDENGKITKQKQEYDRKRTNGRGPRWVAFSEKGGQLHSA